MGGKGLVNDMVVVCLGQASKPVENIIIPAVASDDHPASYKIRGVNKLKSSGYGLDLGLESDQVSDKV